MRSLKYLPAALSLFSTAVSAAPEPEADTWVVVTQTHTVTVCPITEWHTCDNVPTWTPGPGLTTTASTTKSEPWTGTSSTSKTTTVSGESTSSTTSTYSHPYGSTTTTTSDAVSTTTTISDVGSTTTTTGSVSFYTTTTTGTITSSMTTTESTTSASTTTTTYAGGPGWHYPTGKFFLSLTYSETTEYLGFDNSELSIAVTSQSEAALLTIIDGLLVTGNPAQYVESGSAQTNHQLRLSPSSDAAITVHINDNGTITIPGFPEFCGNDGKFFPNQNGAFAQNGTFNQPGSQCKSFVLGVVADPNSVTTTTTTTTSSSMSITTTATTTGVITTTTGMGYNGTTTTGLSNNTITTTGLANSTITTTASISTSTGLNSTTTTALNSTSTCNNATHTATGLPEGPCNGPNTRSQWCGGKSVSDDTNHPYISGQRKTFDLVITNTTAGWNGVTAFDFAINGQSPGPLIELNWGDIAVITVHNQMQDNATTIHWHGIRQFGTNDQDGVPGVTECGIAPGSSRTYTWVASTYGTGWYHGHALSQYGGGVRGPIIIHGPATANYDLDLGQIMIEDVYSAPMATIAARAARFAGPPPIAINYLLNGKNKAPDGINGETPKWIMKAGKKHLIRIINSSAQGSYIVHLDGHNFTVISADYTPIVPYVTENLYIQSGQRYNVIVEANQQPSAYYFRAITQAGCATPNVNNGLGVRNGIFEYETSCGVTPSNAFANSTLPFNLADCADEKLSNLKPFVVMDAGDSAKFTADVKTLPAGNADVGVYQGYGPIVRWFFGGSGVNATQRLIANYSQPTLQTLTDVGAPYNSSIYSNAVVLDGAYNDWVYFVIQNPFRTSHPIHLHGHDFSVLGQGKGFFDTSMIGQLDFTNPIRRDTALLYGTLASPSGWTVIGFKTDNPGAWLMHCHIIWHADGGMALQYIEQPDKIFPQRYTSQQSFKDECTDLKSYEAQGDYRHVEPFSSGLKRRQHLNNHLMHGLHKDVVRHL